jgi:hypothetical protein
MKLFLTLLYYWLPGIVAGGVMVLVGAGMKKEKRS